MCPGAVFSVLPSPAHHWSWSGSIPAAAFSTRSGDRDESSSSAGQDQDTWRHTSRVWTPAMTQSPVTDPLRSLDNDEAEDLFKSAFNGTAGVIKITSSQPGGEQDPQQGEAVCGDAVVSGHVTTLQRSSTRPSRWWTPARTPRTRTCSATAGQTSSRRRRGRPRCPGGCPPPPPGWRQTSGSGCS